MNRIITLGLAGTLLFGVSGAVIAQDLDVDMGVATELGIETDLGTDPGVTGAIGTDVTFGGLVSDLQAGIGLSPNLDEFEQAATIHCVTVSGLEGGMDGAAGLDAAIAAQADQLAELHADLTAHLGFVAQVERSCPGLGAIAIQQVLGVQQGAGGEFIVYVDDRA